MTFKEKRRSKKLAIIYMVIAYVMAALFFALVVLSATRVIHINNGGTPQMWHALLGVSPLILCAFFGMFSGWSSMKRTQYKYGIIKYREYRNFNIILDYLEAGKINEAKNLFNSLPKTDLRVFTNGFILGYTQLLVGNDEVKAKAIDKLNTLREEFSQYNVNFD